MHFCLISEITHSSNIQRREVELNIILPRVNNFDVEQKGHEIFILLYATNTKQDLGRKQQIRSKHKYFL